MSSIVACDSYMWPHNGQSYIADTIVIDTIFNGNVNGCDSIVTLALTINSIDTTVTVTFMNIASNTSGAIYQWMTCDGNYIPIPGETNQNFVPTSQNYFAVEITLGACIDTSECDYYFWPGLDEIQPGFSPTIFSMPFLNGRILPSEVIPPSGKIPST